MSYKDYDLKIDKITDNKWYYSVSIKDSVLINNIVSTEATAKTMAIRVMLEDIINKRG